MGPTRIRQNAEASSSSQVKKFTKSLRHFRPKQDDRFPALTGVQKLKSSLRQTRRLLAKDNLAADIRVETERRLKALEADLVKAESSKKERTLAVRYHKVKFFERQKVLRKLNQTKTKLAADKGGKAKELENTLENLRVDLNYVMHYPKSKKYISLFPPEVRNGIEEQDPPKPENSEQNDSVRGEVREWIREKMKEGELQTQPELHLQERGSFRGTDKRKVKLKNQASNKEADYVLPSETGLVEGDFFDSDYQRSDSN